MDGPVSEGGAVLASAPQPVNSATTATPGFFSLSDRIGRLRYFTYTLIALVACGLGLIPIYLLSLLMPDALGKLLSTTSFILVKNVMIPLIVFVMSIRRLHDLNANGWWALTVLIPFVTLVLLVLPGQRETNRYGPPPPANPASLALAAVLLPTAVVGLYFFMVSINAAMKPVTAPAADGQAHPPLRNYGGK